MRHFLASLRDLLFVQHKRAIIDLDPRIEVLIVLEPVDIQTANSTPSF